MIVENKVLTQNHNLLNISKNHRKSVVFSSVFAIIDLVLASAFSIIGFTFLPYDIKIASSSVFLGFYDVYKILFLDIFSFIVPIVLVIGNSIVLKTKSENSEKQYNKFKKMRNFNILSVFFMIPISLLYWVVIVLFKILV